MAAPLPDASFNVELCDVSNATIISLWRRIYSNLDTDDIVSGMLVCKAFCKELPALVKEVEIDGEFDQEQLVYLARTYSNVERLMISQEYDDNSPVLAFDQVKLPALKSLSLHCKRLESLSFTENNTPLLESLYIDNCGQFALFDLDLPQLTSISFEFAQVDDPSDFGPSLSKCPKLQRFSSYKLWGLSGRVHRLHLPQCTSLDLSRSDDLEALELWTPKLSHLGLRACYSLHHVRIMDVDPAAPGPTAQPLTVNLINASIDRVSKQHLKQHPRVKAGGIWTRESQEWGGLAAELGMAEDEMGMDYGEGGSDESDEDDDGDDEFGGGGGVQDLLAALAAQPGFMEDEGLREQLMQGLVMQMMAGGLMGPGLFPVGDFLDYVEEHLEEEDEDEEDEEEDGDGSGWETADEEQDDDVAAGRDTAGVSQQQPGDAAPAGSSAQDGDAAGGGRKARTSARAEPSCVIEEVE